jgi:hypothetical protein
MGMAALSGSERGGTLVDQILLIALSVSICTGTHLVLALSKHRLAWLLWVACLSGTIYSQYSFITHSNLRAGKVRAENSVQVQSTEQQIRAVRDALADITARPISIIASQITATDSWQERRELKLELGEAKRAANLKDELVKLAGTISNAKVTSSADPVATEISQVTGIAEARISFYINLGSAILLELIGVMLWYEILGRPIDTPKIMDTNHLSMNDSVFTLQYPDNRSSKSSGRQETAVDYENESIRAAIQAGKCQPTVAGIRSYLGCAMAKALKIHRALSKKSNPA